MLVHTEDTGGAGGSAHSTDEGKTWTFYEKEHAYDYEVKMKKTGLAMRLTNREEVRSNAQALHQDLLSAPAAADH